MIPLKALAIAVPLAALSAWVLARASGDVAALRRDLATEETAGHHARAAVERLEPHAVDRQLEVLDRRRSLSAELARARRDRVLGALGVAAAALVAAGAAVVTRAARDAQETRDPAPRDPDL